MATIIAASDLSERSRQVVPRACQLAQVLGASVTVVHVAVPGTPAARTERSRQALAEQCELVAGDMAVEVEVLNGRPELVLPELAARTGAELLVLGLHRSRPVLDLLRLTTMERTVLRSDVPVLLAHRPVEDGYRRVLAAIDFAPACARALIMAARLAPGATFHAIHALQLPLSEKLAPGGGFDTEAMTVAQTTRRGWLAGNPGLPETLVSPEIIPGGVHEVLRFRLDELQPDLLTIGTHSGLDPDRLGNYARDIIREPRTDVLIAKPSQPA